MKNQLLLLLENLNLLELRKKIALGAGLGILLVTMITISILLNKPATIPLYSNLTQQDINSMSRILSENGIVFIASSDSQSINVAPEKLADARMILAEYGLPASSESGYELFDNVNSLGLTSFMQEVTNKRAIQGELSRTIQMMTGVISARVHLVMPSKRIFTRKGEGDPSASLVLKTNGILAAKTILAIRHMVAAAVLGLESERVVIVSANGRMMTTSTEEGGARFSRLSELESNYERESERKIYSALGAHLGADNFRITVSTKLNADRSESNETVFDPESRVERSVQIIREKGAAENNSNNQSATITQNLPEEPETSGPGLNSQENTERREELTNYEISRKETSVFSVGYKVEKLSVALVVNSTRISALLGDNATQAELDAKVTELEEIVKSALSFSSERGDSIKISIIEFLPEEVNNSEYEVHGTAYYVGQHLGSIVNALGTILGALAFAVFGMRPLISFLKIRPPNANENSTLSLPGVNAVAGDVSDKPLANPEINQMAINGISDSVNSNNQLEINSDDGGSSEISVRDEKIREQLGDMISQSEERAAGAIKHWLNEDKVSA